MCDCTKATERTWQSLARHFELIKCGQLHPKLTLPHKYTSINIYLCTYIRSSSISLSLCMISRWPNSFHPDQFFSLMSARVEISRKGNSGSNSSCCCEWENGSSSNSNNSSGAVSLKEASSGPSPLSPDQKSRRYCKLHR